MITGTDPAFCAGLNLRSLGTDRLTDLPPFNATVAASRVPVIAAVNGPAVTGGATALRIGIANHVVPHEELLPTAMRDRGPAPGRTRPVSGTAHMTDTNAADGQAGILAEDGQVGEGASGAEQHRPASHAGAVESQPGVPEPPQGADRRRRAGDVPQGRHGDEGRTSDDAAYWLAGATPAWRDAVEVVAIDMCAIFASAVRGMLPGARIAVDLFHVVQLAVKATGDVRRRAIRELYGRRGKAGDPEYGIKSLLNRNLENLSPEQFEKVIDTLDATAPASRWPSPGSRRRSSAPP